MKTLLSVLFLFLATNVFAETDSSPSLQATLDEKCASQKVMVLPAGRYYLYSPLILTTNCKISGQGSDFGTVLQPMGQSAAFIIDGVNVTGDTWAFRNTLQGFTIDGSTSSAAELIKINKAYTTRLINIFIYNQATPVGIDITESNNIVLDKVVLYGLDKANGRAGVVVRDKSSVTLNDVDIENYSRCFKSFGNSTTDINSAYMERCIVNIEHSISGMGSVNVFGGKLMSINGYNIGLNAGNFNLSGTKLESYNGTTLNGPIAMCLYGSYENTKLRGVAGYDGYLAGSGCVNIGVIE